MRLLAGEQVNLESVFQGAARNLVETQRIPAIANGMARGILPADHPLSFSAARGAALKRADLVVIAGTAIDFRVGYGGAFGSAKVVHLQDHPSRIARYANLAASAAGPLADLLLYLFGASAWWWVVAGVVLLVAGYRRIGHPELETDHPRPES